MGRWGNLPHHHLGLRWTWKFLVSKRLSDVCLLLISHPPTPREFYERLEKVRMNDKSPQVRMRKTSSLLSVEIPTMMSDVLCAPCRWQIPQTVRLTCFNTWSLNFRFLLRPASVRGCRLDKRQKCHNTRSCHFSTTNVTTSISTSTTNVK